MSINKDTLNPSDARDSDSARNVAPDPGPLATPSEISKKPASIGPSITIHGDVTGDEDLVVSGTVEGTVNLKEHSLVIGKNGHVMANITARMIRVDGEVKGELRAGERVVIKPTGNVNGDIRSPRVVLEEGCRFKGSVDMESDKATLSPERSHPRLRPTPSRGRGKFDALDKLTK